MGRAENSTMTMSSREYRETYERLLEIRRGLEKIIKSENGSESERVMIVAWDF